MDAACLNAMIIRYKHVKNELTRHVVSFMDPEKKGECYSLSYPQTYSDQPQHPGFY